jgi:hypothetical protein
MFKILIFNSQGAGLKIIQTSRIFSVVDLGLRMSFSHSIHNTEIKAKIDKPKYTGNQTN